MNPSEEVRILCVDDERNVLKSLRRLFIDEDHYDILTAESGEEGLAVLRECPDISLVISDYRMPGMTGVEFLRQVNEHWPDTVRIVLSGYADTAAVVEAINAGQIYKFIPKPWNDDELKTTVAQALAHYQLFRQNEQLTEELRVKNEELEEVNQNLEELVEKRTIALELRNQVLGVSQQVLDVLPVAVLGVDPEGMIAQCNDQSGALLGLGMGDMLGYNRREVLPREVNRALDQVGLSEAASIVIELDGRMYSMEVRPLDPAEPRGTVVAWVPCRCDNC